MDHSPPTDPAQSSHVGSWPSLSVASVPWRTCFLILHGFQPHQVWPSVKENNLDKPKRTVDFEWAFELALWTWDAHPQKKNWPNTTVPPFFNSQFRDDVPSSHFFGPLQLFVTPLLQHVRSCEHSQEVMRKVYPLSKMPGKSSCFLLKLLMFTDTSGSWWVFLTYPIIPQFLSLNIYIFIIFVGLLLHYHTLW